MAQTTINGRDGTADFTIAGDSYKTILTRFDVTAGQEQIDVTTFNEEGTTKNDPGRLVIGFSATGLLTKGGAQSGPLIPPPQDVEIVATYSTGCTITMTKADVNQASASRVVNANGIIQFSGVADGSITTVWNTGS